MLSGDQVVVQRHHPPEGYLRHACSCNRALVATCSRVEEVPCCDAMGARCPVSSSKVAEGGHRRRMLRKGRSSRRSFRKGSRRILFRELMNH